MQKKARIISLAGVLIYIISSLIRSYKPDLFSDYTFGVLAGISIGLMVVGLILITVVSVKKLRNR